MIKYHFDALGRRIAKVSGLAEGRDRERGHDREDRDHDRDRDLKVISYAYLADQDKILLARDPEGRVSLYLDGPGIDDHLGEIGRHHARGYVKDHLGSIMNSAASGGIALYSAFGEGVGQREREPEALREPVLYGFTGRQVDPESGLYYYRARMYLPQVGRFLSKDSIWPRGGLNPYIYALNEPLNFIDPRGTDYTVPTDGGTLVYPGDPGAGVEGPANFIPSQTMTTVDAPAGSGVIGLGPAIAAGAVIGAVVSGPAGVVAAGVIDVYFGPDPQTYPQLILNNANKMGQTLWPDDPAFKPRPSPSCGVPR